MLQTIVLIVGALALVALAPLILRFLIPLVGIALIFLFIFGTGGLGGAVALIILIACFLVGKFFKGESKDE